MAFLPKKKQHTIPLLDEAHGIAIVDRGDSSIQKTFDEILRNGFGLTWAGKRWAFKGTTDEKHEYPLDPRDRSSLRILIQALKSETGGFTGACIVTGAHSLLICSGNPPLCLRVPSLTTEEIVTLAQPFIAGKFSPGKPGGAFFYKGVLGFPV